MDIKRKLQIVEQAIQSISTHDDADSVVILAALGRIQIMLDDQAKALRDKQIEAANAAISE